MASTWSEQYLEEWKRSKEEVFRAFAQMFDQYDGWSRSYDQFQELVGFLSANWRTIPDFILGNSVIPNLRGKFTDEVEEMMVAVHCLAVITSDKLDKKYYPDAESDVCHDFMSAGEAAVEQLERFGLMTASPGGGNWTSAGIEMLNGNLR